MTMSTYKSLAGPPGGLIVTNDAALAQRLEAIAFPGLTANSDAGRQAALAVTLLDWLSLGAAQARAMVALAQALAGALADAGLRVHAIDRGATSSHQFALEAAAHGGGHAAALRLEAAGFLASAIGLPVPPAAAVPGCAPGLRIGTPELVRRGVAPADAPALARLIARGLTGPDPARVAPLTRALRARFTGLHYVRE
jgi:glycine hydroxymethyltransferase